MFCSTRCRATDDERDMSGDRLRSRGGRDALVRTPQLSDEFGLPKVRMLDGAATSRTVSIATVGRLHGRRKCTSTWRERPTPDPRSSSTCTRVNPSSAARRPVQVRAAAASRDNPARRAAL